MRALLLVAIAVLAGCAGPASPESGASPSPELATRPPTASNEIWYFHGLESNDFIRPMDRVPGEHKASVGGPVTPYEANVIYVSVEPTVGYSEGGSARVVLFLTTAHPTVANVRVVLESGGGQAGSAITAEPVALTALGGPMGFEYQEVVLEFPFGPMEAAAPLTCQVYFDGALAMVGIGQGGEVASRLELVAA